MSDIETVHKVYVGIGSNIEPIEHIKKCIKSLKENFSNLQLSPIYESSSMGFDGPNFYNLAAFFETKNDLVSLKKLLNDIETQNGRSLGEVKFSSRTLDRDILYSTMTILLMKKRIFQEVRLLNSILSYVLYTIWLQGTFTLIQEKLIIRCLLITSTRK